MEHIVKSARPDLDGPGMGKARARPRAVTGHTRGAPTAGGRSARGDTRAMAPATGFYSTAEDSVATLRPTCVGSKQLLSDASKREMQRVHWHVHDPGSDLFRDYGLGLDLERLANERVAFGHGGGFPGQIGSLDGRSVPGLVVVVLTNCADGPAAEIARGISKCLELLQQHPAPPRARWRRLEGRYANLWGVSDLVGAGQTWSVTSPDTWEPFKSCEELTPTAGGSGPASGWRITDTSSFGSAGGSGLTFTLDGGSVTELRFGACRCGPQTVGLMSKSSWSPERERRASSPLRGHCPEASPSVATVTTHTSASDFRVGLTPSAHVAQTRSSPGQSTVTGSKIFVRLRWSQPD